MEEKFNPAFKYPRHHTAHPKGGVHLTEQAAKVKDVGLSLLKSLGIKIKEEGLFDLLKISRPAIVSYHKSYLECIAEDYTHTKFINKAAEATDPLERLKWVICFYISGIYRNPAFMQNLGPLNPVLGETYITEKSDGTTVYCEQISHHPAVSAYMMVGPNKSYVLSGTGELDAKMKGFNNIIGKRMGKTTINFKDGGKIVFTNPEARIDGLLMGDRRLNYINTCVFLDKVNNLSAEINFLYEPEGTLRKLSTRLHKLFGSSHEKIPGDNFDAVFFRYNKQPDGEIKKEILCEGSGSYLSHIQFDGKMFWKIDDKFDDPWKFSNKQRLPSDSLFRSDAKLIKIKDFVSAQKEKDMLEDRQRADAKLRARSDSRQR